MRYQKLSIIILFFSLYTFLFSQDTIPNNAYNIGERAKFLMYYGWVDAGTAEICIEEDTINGKKVHHAKAVGKTIGIADRLYNVHDVFETWINIPTGLPFKAKNKVKEGGYKSKNTITFYHSKNKLHSFKSQKTHKVPEKILDIVSAYYYMRRSSFNNLTQGDTIVTNTWFQDEKFVLRVRYLGNEMVETDLGEINCLKFSPLVEAGRAFDTEDDLIIWLSDDKNFIPIRVQMDLFIGSFKADLIEYSGLKYKFNNKEN